MSSKADEQQLVNSAAFKFLDKFMENPQKYGEDFMKMKNFAKRIQDNK